jgi:hypothetical protein
LWLDEEEDERANAELSLDSLDGKGEGRPEQAEPIFSSDELSANTLEKAAKQAIHQGVAKNADFSGLDVRVASEMSEALLSTSKIIPQMKDGLDFVGSTDAFFDWKYAEELQVEVAILKAQYPGASDDMLLAMAKDAVTKGSVGVNVVGHWEEFGGKTGIMLSNSYFSEQEIKSTSAKLQHQVLWGVHAPGFETIKGQIDHEIAHQISYVIGANTDNEIKNWYNEFMKSGKEQEILSAYAKNNVDEFIAEAWMEYRNSVSPRELATRIAKRLILLAGGKIK